MDQHDHSERGESNAPPENDGATHEFGESEAGEEREHEPVDERPVGAVERVRRNLSPEDRQVAPRHVEAEQRQRQRTGQQPCTDFGGCGRSTQEGE